MAKPPATTTEDHVSDAAGSAIGMVFKPFEYLWKALDPHVRKFLLWAFFLLFLYPLIAFAAVVYLLDYLPDGVRLPLQKRALESWGLERVYSTTDAINRLNDAVDTSTNLDFPSDESRDWNQYVVPGQKVRLWATTRRTLLPGNSAECVEDMSKVPLGSFSFKIDGVDWIKPKDAGPSQTLGIVKAAPTLVRVLRLDADDWTAIEKVRDNMPPPLPLRIVYTPAAPTPDNIRLHKCFRYDVDAYLEVYKPQLGVGLAGVTK